MNTFLIVTGPPGAGKSTVARLLAETTPRSVLVEGDAFFGFLANGAIDPWLPEAHDQNSIVTRAAARAAGEFAHGGFDVVYDGVVGPWFLETFTTATGSAELDYVVLLPPLEICRQRVAARSEHRFADLAATTDIHRSFVDADIAARHLVREHDTGPEGLAASIRAAQRRSDLRYAPS